MEVNRIFASPSAATRAPNAAPRASGSVGEGVVTRPRAAGSVGEGVVARPSVGALKLPIPSGAARAESLDDGSLQLVDVLPVGRLGEFLGEVADAVRRRQLDAPAWFSVAVHDGMTVRFDRGGVREDVSERMAATIDGIAESIRERRIDPLSFELSLECGCGVRVERAREGPDQEPREGPREGPDDSPGDGRGEGPRPQARAARSP